MLMELLTGRASIAGEHQAAEFGAVPPGCESSDCTIVSRAAVDAGTPIAATIAGLNQPRLTVNISATA